MRKKIYIIVSLLFLIVVFVISLVALFYYFEVIRVPVVYISKLNGEGEKIGYITRIKKFKENAELYVLINIGTKDELKTSFWQKILFSYFDDFSNEFTEVFLVFNVSDNKLKEAFLYTTDNNYFPKDLLNKAQQLKSEISYEENPRDVKLINEDFGIILNMPAINFSQADPAQDDILKYFKVRKTGIVE